MFYNRNHCPMLKTQPECATPKRFKIERLFSAAKFYCKFRGSPRTSVLKRGTSPVNSDNSITIYSAVTWKWCEIRFAFNLNSKLHSGFRSVPKSVTLSDLERRNCMPTGDISAVYLSFLLTFVFAGRTGLIYSLVLID